MMHQQVAASEPYCKIGASQPPYALSCCVYCALEVHICPLSSGCSCSADLASSPALQVLIGFAMKAKVLKAALYVAAELIVQTLPACKLNFVLVLSAMLRAVRTVSHNLHR